MPYQSILDELVRSVDGAQGALLLDALGEVVVESGARDERHRLIGAYQGIALASARKTSARYEVGDVHYILCRYAWGHVILRPLKDGYYLVVSLAPEANVGEGVHRSALTQERMDGAI
ncbi:MAG: roadblock/LC7 domain-containing protein [Acidobacteria bacterium]|nr:roadblock/LC7 domain-containing protein [Acidobacteriota bacterium]